MDQNDEGIFPLSPEDSPKPSVPPAVPPRPRASASPPPRPIPVYLPPASPPTKKQAGRSVFGAIFRYLFALIFIISLIMNAYLLVILYGGTQQQEYRTGDKEQTIALIDLAGTIDMRSADIMRDMLKRADTNKNVKGVIIVVNSPGGYVAPSDMINKYIRDFMETSEKKVYVSIQSVGASGAIWATAPADKIYAQENAVVGSIGVIYLNFMVKGLLEEKLAVKPVVLKSDDAIHKDRGSPFRELTPAEETEIRDDLNRIHQRFVKIVAQGREPLTQKEVEALATGEIFDGDEAVANKLIDKMGFLDDCIDDLADVLKLDDPHVVRYVRPLTLMELLMAKSTASQTSLPLQKELEQLAKPPHIKALWLGR